MLRSENAMNRYDDDRNRRYATDDLRACTGVQRGVYGRYDEDDWLSRGGRRETAWDYGDHAAGRGPYSWPPGRPPCIDGDIRHGDYRDHYGSDRGHATSITVSASHQRKRRAAGTRRSARCRTQDARQRTTARPVPDAPRPCFRCAAATRCSVARRSAATGNTQRDRRARRRRRDEHRGCHQNSGR